MWSIQLGKNCETVFFFGTGGMKSTGTQLADDRVHPPDKKKFERDIAEINGQIKDLEAKLVSSLFTIQHSSTTVT